MRTYPLLQKKTPTQPSLVVEALISMAGGVILFLFFTLLLTTGYGLSHVGQIFPGISIAGVDVSGLTPDQAASLLDQELIFAENGKIVFKYGDQVWVAKPAELGLSLDAKTSAQAAYTLGRSGNPMTDLPNRLRAWHAGRDLPPLLIYDQRVAYDYLEGIVAQLDRPTLEAALTVSGSDVVVLPGQVGRKTDLPAALTALETQLRSLTDGIIPLVVEESPPAILDASQQAEIARGILSSSLTLQLPDKIAGDPGPWVLPPDQLANMLVIERVQSPEGARYQVMLSSQALQTYLTGLAPDINRQPSNARFIFNDDTHLLEVIQPAVIGRSLDIEATIQEINTRILAGERSASLSIQTTQPEIGDSTTGEQLGIREQITAYTSYFRGSTTERLQNIKTAAANFHGLLVPPGATFSMAEVLGNVTLDAGYAEAWIIFGGRTIKGVGGGVCQVSTTLFRAVFFAGYPIIERYPHAYRVGYYEQTRTGTNPNLAGLDATVFVPMVDFKFQNDTPYYLLMETYFNPTSRSLTWKFYSTSDGRTVDWGTTGTQNIVEPPDPVYEENPELAKGVIRQVDWAAEGADVTVTRTVSRDGQVLYSDVFTTHYLPWADVFQYGPGTQLPTDNPKKRPRTWEIALPVAV
ncbi:MAG: VanW family protein [Anaerolineales bacterium]|nr:VanW family protein [Anaerolineales bacterium]